jgi:uncharacterized protein (UPF0332 family)
VKHVVAESHSAVRRLFGRELIKTEEVEKEWARILAHEQDQRVGADYDAEFAVGAETAAESVRDARRFVDRIKRYLVSNGVRVDEGQ